MTEPPALAEITRVAMRLWETLSPEFRRQAHAHSWQEINRMPCYPIRPDLSFDWLVVQKCACGETRTLMEAKP